MKTILALSILFSAIALPALGELTKTELNEIRLIVKEEVQTEIREFNVQIDDNFRSLEKRFESIEKNFDRQNTLIIACIAIPMAILTLLIAWRSVKDTSQEKKIEALTQEIETLKQQHIIHP